MKRDKDKIRNIMLSLREGITIDVVKDTLNIYHIELLAQAGWVEWDECFSCEEYHIYNRLRLTWNGYEVADLLIDTSKWDKIKGSGLYDSPFDVIIDHLNR